ncbi:MAG: hypothetical protein HYZ25_19510 [Chloroflexi bacterium]|nr:hypothetical protein [Chloroflexota bacterium]
MGHGVCTGSTLVLMPGLRREGTRISFQVEEMLSAYHTFRAAVELAE